MVTSQPILRYITRIVPALIIAATLSACSTSPNTARQVQSETRTNSFILQASQDEFEQLVNNADVKSKLMSQYASWKGVAYRLGGTTRSGIDCSAFVRQTFLDQFGMELPRSTAEQQSVGTSVKRAKLQAGDLVLFKTGKRQRHVGIYVGNDKFVHASTSNGVIVSNMTDKYWNNRYYDGRRLIK